MALLGFGSSKSSSKSTSYLPQQKEALLDALDVYLPTLGQNQNVYQGDRVADLTGVQQGVLDSAPNFLDMFGTPQKAGTPLSQETGTAVKDLLAGDVGGKQITPEQTEHYFKTSLYDPTMYALKNDVLPSIDEGFAGGNFFGSGRAKARESAASDTARYLSEAKGDLDWDVLQSNQALAESKADRTLNTLGSAMQYGQQPAQETMNNLSIAAAQIGGLNDLFGIGQQGQTQEQAEIQAAITQYAEENQITDPTNLAILLSLIGQTMSYSKGSGSSFNVGFGQ